MAHPIATPQTPSARTNLPVDGDGLRRLRIDLAACLRWAARNGLEEGICNHFSAVLPERPDLFLVNPYGLAFAEVTASSLLLCDFHGNVVEGDGLPEATAFHIHAELHRLKPNARAAFHGAVAKIFAAENSAFSGGVPLSAEAVPTPSNGFTDLDEAGHQTVNRHRNALFGEYYFARRTFATRPQKAVAAQGNGRLAKEIVPVAIPQRKGDPVVVEIDEHPRGDTTLEKLAKLPTPFKKEGGTVTAGNASGVNDGAAALILASEKAAAKYGLTPLARVLGGAAAGVAPRVMGLGPIPATRKLCERLGLKPTDFDIVELNEAFASQGIAVLRDLGIREDADFVNPNGGAIALGHPLGMSGARIAGTAALELSLTGKRRALATMCIGVGQGIAIALERV